MNVIPGKLYEYTNVERRHRCIYKEFGNQASSLQKTPYNWLTPNALCMFLEARYEGKPYEHWWVKVLWGEKGMVGWVRFYEYEWREAKQ